MIIFSDELQKKRQSYNDFIRDFRKFLKEEEPEVIKMVLAYLRKQQKSVSLSDIKQALSDGHFDDDDVFEKWKTDCLKFVSVYLMSKWKTAMKAGTEKIKRHSHTFSFDLKYGNTEKWLKNHAAEFVKDITKNQRDTLNVLIVRAAKENINPDALAKQIRSAIGLTKKDALANQRLYLKRYQSILQTNPKISIEKAEQMAAQSAAEYAKKQLDRRSMTIARTELARGYNAGEYYGIKQAQKEKVLGKMKKATMCAGPEACKGCLDIDGMEVGIDEYFVTNWGEFLYPPYHPCCRCCVVYIEEVRR